MLACSGRGTCVMAGVERLPVCNCFCVVLTRVEKKITGESFLCVSLFVHVDVLSESPSIGTEMGSNST